MNLTDVNNAGPGDLARLFKACSAVDLSQSTLSPRDEMFVGHGSMKIGRLVRQIGFDGSEFHLELVNLLLTLPSCRHVGVAAYGIYALAEHGIPPLRIVDRLIEIASSPLRSDEHPRVTARSLAFRMLVRVDPSTAEALGNLEACREYADAVKHWMSDTNLSARTASELHAEREWLITRGCCRTND
ncbi:MAG: hypothetical protein WD049_06200 [Candidatus Paceibacterota bacterium]